MHLLASWYPFDLPTDHKRKENQINKSIRLQQNNISIKKKKKEKKPKMKRDQQKQNAKKRTNLTEEATEYDGTEVRIKQKMPSIMRGHKERNARATHMTNNGSTQLWTTKEDERITAQQTELEAKQEKEKFNGFFLGFKFT